MTEELEEQHADIHPATQFLYLVLIIIAGTALCVIASLFAIVLLYGFDVFKSMGSLSATSAPEVLNSVRIFQSFTSIFMFLMPPLFFGYLIVHEPKDYLKTTTRFPILLLLVVLAIMFVSSPAMEWVVNLNQHMVFPKALQWLYDAMRKSEDEAAKLTAIFLKMNNIGDLIINMIMIAILPAIAEEFLFRGAVQTIFTRWTKNPHWGIWIAAILFSAIHNEFFGFLPRMLLGAGLGYFVWWSGSIWTSVWGHFLNNGTIVVVTYLFQHKLIKVSPDDAHVFNYGYYAFSLVITVLLFILYRKITLTKTQPEQAV